MNIFALDPNPKVAANFHCDQHLNKMILEAAQMACTVAHMRGTTLRDMPFAYRPTHASHPCTKWLASSNWNLVWLLDMATELDYIRQFVFGSTEHASLAVLRETVWMLAIHEVAELPGEWENWKDKVTPFVRAMPEQFKIMKVPDHVAYREYYRHKNEQWGNTMTWKHRGRPDWMGGV